MRRVLTLSLLSLILVLQCVSFVFATESETIKRTQTVYSVIDWDGNLKETSVVNWIRYNGTGNINLSDNPDISEIVPLNTDTSYSKDGDDITWSFNSDGVYDLFYKGRTDVNLPIDVVIETYLNGEKTSIANANKQSGELEFSFTFTNKLPHEETIEWEVGGETKSKRTTVYTPLIVMLQADVAAADFDSIKADGAFEITIGSSKKLMWSVLPMPEETIKLVITSNKIRPPTFSISVIPNAPYVPIPDIDTGMLDLMAVFGDSDDLLEMMDSMDELDMSSALESVEMLSGLSDALSQNMTDAMAGFDGLSQMITEYGTSLSSILDGAKGLVELSEGHKMVLETIQQELQNNSGSFDSMTQAVIDANNLAKTISKNIFSISFYLDDALSLVGDLKRVISDTTQLEKLAEIESNIKKSSEKLELIKGDSDKASNLLSALTDGGTIDGKEIPGVSDMPEMMGLFDETLTALISGGSIQGVDMPGITTTIDGLKGIGDGISIMLNGGEFDGQVIPSWNELGTLLQDAKEGMSVFVEGGELDGITIPSPDELSDMIGEFRDSLEKTAPMQERLSELSEEISEAINNAGGVDAIGDATTEVEELFYLSKAEYNRMKELAKEYTSFVGDTPNSESNVMFVIKLQELSLVEQDDATAKDKEVDETPFKDLSKGRIYILIIASAIILLAIGINWWYKKRYSN
ncbi:MAG TPA: hypothetical protein PKV16_03640 [Caldisericia bacterium]|nr:hypothetical protein [Caldisericia bacterium]HPF48404.1 hypothetical protein [Caldisericia bacterium]HPI83416.1 hypothetical protein [Caldisericia bacterium]HPQ92858.1 hypothetical protein [Caldisericia bacterium]HRV74044.1 hypothetical protein [Caldisericia bacterium]